MTPAPGGRYVQRMGPVEGRPGWCWYRPLEVAAQPDLFLGGNVQVRELRRWKASRQAGDAFGVTP